MAPDDLKLDTRDPGDACRYAAALVIDAVQQHNFSNTVAQNLLGVAGQLACGRETPAEAIQGLIDYTTSLRNSDRAATYSDAIRDIGKACVLLARQIAATARPDRPLDPALARLLDDLPSEGLPEPRLALPLTPEDHEDD